MSQVENQSQNSSENALSKRFEQERRDWINKIQEFSDQLKHISQIGYLPEERGLYKPLVVPFHWYKQRV